MVGEVVATTTGMVMTDQFVQVNYLRSLIQDVLTDQEVDVVINNTNQNLVVTGTITTYQDITAKNAVTTGTVIQIMTSDATNVD